MLLTMETAESHQRARIRYVLLSLTMSVGILGCKYLAFRVSGSTALQSDAIEGIVNVLAAAFALFAIVFAGKPADRDHPYGHGKIEDLSAAFEGGLVAIAAALILFEGVDALVRGPKLRNLDLGLVLNIGAGVLNGGLGWVLVRAGRRHRSKALEADGRHVLSDFITTVGLAFGLLLVMFTGWVWLDPVIAILIGVSLGFTGFRLVRDSAVALLDSEDPKKLSAWVAAMEKVRPVDVIAVHEMRTLRSGRYTHVDLHVVVPEFYPMSQAHDLVESFSEASIREGGFEGEFHSHIDPCMRLYCRRCAVAACPVRREPCTGTIPITVDSATEGEPEKS